MNGTQDDTLLQELVRDAIHRWRSGEQPDADGLLKRHPELARHKSLAIDLIYEEYCLRHEQGDTLVPSTFCERFPHYEQSLTRMLDVHETLEEAKPARSPWPQEGESFLGYELVEALGRGSLARVFLARETAVGKRLVVVKISRHGAGEAHLLGKAAHPGIVPILSVTHDETTGWTVICMPLLGTATGTDLLKAAFSEGRRPMSASVIAEVAAQPLPGSVTAERAAELRALDWRGTYSDGVARLGLLLAEGLAAAHGVGIMHRDIKPSNVLLSWAGQPMLLDFNLSTEGGPKAERVAGTLAYMAPELMEAMQSSRGRPSQPFDPRADIYSLGALLYQLLTNRLPVQPDHPEQLTPGDAGPWLAARRQGVVSPQTIDPQIDLALESIILRCLAENPAGRFSSAGELAGKLRDYLGWLPSGVRTVRRRRREVLIAGLAAAAMAIGGGIYISRLPPLEERLFARGHSQYARQQYAAAAATWGRCLELRPDWPEARFARGQALRMSGDCGAARTEFLELQILSVPLAYSQMGYCDLVLGNTVAADTDYRLAKSRGADDAVMWNNLGFCERVNGKRAEAIQSFDEALRRDPNLAVAFANRALARFKLPSNADDPATPEVVNDIRRACELDDSRADFHFHAASIWVKVKGGDAQVKEQARDHLARAAELGYPRQALEGIASELRDGGWDLPHHQAPPKPYRNPPLYAAPSESADLGGFLSK